MAKLKTMVVKIKGEDGVENELTVALLGPKGNPLYEIDGKDVEQDIVELRSILKSSNDENAARRISEKEAKERLTLFEGIDPEKAREALTTVANLNDKQLVDAKQVETLKTNLEASWKTKLEQTEAGYQGKITELTSALDAEKAKIKGILIKNSFLGSEYLKQTMYDPVREDAYKIFSDRFDVEPGDNGDLAVVLKLPDGSNLISVATPGKVAGFDEAIEHIIMNHPQKDHILKGSGASGSGAQGGGSGGAKTTLQQLQEKYNAAQKAGNASEMRRLKDEIHAIQQGG